jgi:hypothetical protein
MSTCCTNLANITRECGTGVRPGIATKVYVICKDEVTTIPAASGHIISDPFVLENDKFFSVWDVSQMDSSYLVEPQGDVDMRFYKATVQFYIPALAPAKSFILNGITNGEFIVLVADAKGQVRLLGDLDRGAYISFQEQTNDKNGYAVTIEWECNALPLYYDDVIVTS